MDRRQFLRCLLPLLATLFAAAAPAQVHDSAKHRFVLKTLTEGLEHPWGLAFLPDGRMLVTERAGRLRLVAADGKLDPVPVSGLPPIAAVGQGGLLDVVLHPDYAKNGWVYFSYAAPGEGGQGTEVARARLDGRALRDLQVEIADHLGDAEILLNVADIDGVWRCHAPISFARAMVSASSHATAIRFHVMRASMKPPISRTTEAAHVTGLAALNGMPNALMFGSSMEFIV